MAENVRVECARRGWNQSDLARALGVSSSTVNAKWRGARQWQLDELEDVADVLGVTVADLMSADKWAHWGSNPEPTDKTFAHVIPLFGRAAA